MIGKVPRLRSCLIPQDQQEKKWAPPFLLTVLLGSATPSGPRVTSLQYLHSGQIIHIHPFPSPCTRRAFYTLLPKSELLKPQSL